MKNLKYILISLVTLAAVSCDNDGEILTTAGADAVTLSGETSDIVLDYDNADDVALTIYWSDNGTITLSNSDYSPPENATTNTVQFSATDDFETIYEDLAESGVYEAEYTVSALNSILSRLSFTPDESAPLYIRVESSLADNIDPTYSNVLTVNVTPYELDLTVGYVLTSSKVLTDVTLYSENSDGDYWGFMGVTAWYNWYLQEGDGTIWGNYAVDGYAFYADSGDDIWNFWFPEPDGCYYVNVNTSTALWSALYISSLTISGDLSGEMTYTRQTNKWTYTFTSTSTGTISVQIAGTGAQYDYTTSTDDSAATSTAVAFGQSGSEITFGSTASDISVSVPYTGEVTLTLDLSDPTNWTVEVTEGSAEETYIPDYLYLPGIDDGESGSWTFENMIKLYDEDTQSYAALCYVNSLYGYQIATEVDNWSDVYFMDSGDATSGTLVYGSGTNIPAPDEGLYLIHASIGELTYYTLGVSTVQYAGISDDWTPYDMTLTDEANGIFTATIAITADTSWGFQILLDNSWTNYFGGSDGELTFQGSNVPCDFSAGSTVTLTVNLCACTYTLEAN